MAAKLGRRVPTTWEHVDKYPLRALAEEERPKGEPVVLGINWHRNFSFPEQKDGLYWIGRGNPEDWGPIDGGHAIACKPDRVTDLGTWHRHYDQQRNSCVGHSVSRSRTLVERRLYDGEWLYDQALPIDEWSGEADVGTSLNAGFKVVHALGPMRFKTQRAEPSEGVSAYRWLQSVDEIRTVLDSPSNDRWQAVKLVNSWGVSYPHYVWLPYSTLAYLLRQHGEAVTATSR